LINDFLNRTRRDFTAFPLEPLAPITGRRFTGKVDADTVLELERFFGAAACFLDAAAFFFGAAACFLGADAFFLGASGFPNRLPVLRFARLFVEPSTVFSTDPVESDFVFVDFLLTAMD
jgi:hypothetical protein